LGHCSEHIQFTLKPRTMLHRRTNHIISQINEWVCDANICSNAMRAFNIFLLKVRSAFTINFCLDVKL